MRKINSKRLARSVESRMAYDLDNNNINAASVIIKQGGESVYSNNFGLANEKSVYRIASMTKPITAAAIMTLFDKGLLSIDDAVSRYLPNFSALYLAEINKNKDVIKAKPLNNQLTIKHLLTHSSGLLNGISGEIYYKEMTDEQNRTLKNAVDFYSDCAVEFEPFTRQEYNPTAAFDVLARIAEVVSGKQFEEYLNESIFTPLNMMDTTFVPTDQQWERIVKMHDKKNGKSVEGITYDGCVFEKTPVSHTLGGAGLISTINDYSNFAEMLLNGGLLFGKRILSQQSVKMISTPQISEEIMPLNERWGLGVRVIVGEDDELPMGSYGWSGAYGTHFWVDNENMITAVYMKNSKYDGGSGAVTAANFEIDVYNSLN